MLGNGKQRSSRVVPLNLLTFRLTNGLEVVSDRSCIGTRNGRGCRHLHFWRCESRVCGLGVRLRGCGFDPSFVEVSPHDHERLPEKEEKELKIGWTGVVDLQLRE